MYYVGVIISIICSVIVPLVLSIYICKKDKGYIKPILLGALTFFVSQILIRIPIIQLILPNMSWYIKMSVAQPILYALFLSFTAGLFEEGGRYITMKLLLKNRQNTKNAIAFGVGHGGIEAIIFVGINAIALLFMYTPVVDPFIMIAGGVERLSAISLHIACSVMVMKSVENKKILWFLFALLTHTMFNFVAVMMQHNGFGFLAIESVLLLFAVICVVFIRYEYIKNSSK